MVDRRLEVVGSLRSLVGCVHGLDHDAPKSWWQCARSRNTSLRGHPGCCLERCCLRCWERKSLRHGHVCRHLHDPHAISLHSKFTPSKILTHISLNDTGSNLSHSGRAWSDVSHSQSSLLGCGTTLMHRPLLFSRFTRVWCSLSAPRLRSLLTGFFGHSLRDTSSDMHSHPCSSS